MERLEFQPLRPSHAAGLYPALSDPRVSEYLNCEPPASVELLAEDFARLACGPPSARSDEAWLNWAVRLRESGQWIGRVQATVHCEWVEVAYLFGPAFWGHGYATESLSWLHSHLHDMHGTSEFWATVALGNQRSIRLLLRVGYSPTERCDSRPLGSYDDGDMVFCRVGRN
jgi:RimJ/RimL family protein N-acetyltransferase